MKKFMIAAEYCNDFLDECARLNDLYGPKGSLITEVFGSHFNGLIGSGRGANVSPYIPDTEGLKKYISYAHSIGIKYDYVLNARCISDMETQSNFLNKLKEVIDTLLKIKVDIITVTNSFLLEFIFQNYDIKLSMSLFAFPSSPEIVSTLVKMGASRITILQDINRDFSAIKSIRENTDAELIIIVNPQCKLHCPWTLYHASYDAHTIDPQSIPTKSASAIYRTCYNQRFSNPEEIVKAPWIRPEDLNRYTEPGIGISLFKIQGRLTLKIFPWTVFLKKVEAYMVGDFNGDLINLIFSLKDNCPFYLPNKQLNSFLDFFINKKIHCYDDCGECNYCQKVAEKYIVKKIKEL